MISRYIGIILIIHWVLLLIDRISYNIFPNIFWISHLVLFLAAIGLLLRNNLIITGSFIAVVVFHGLWIIDFTALLITGNSPLNYTNYMLNLTLYRQILAIHHIYLLPLLGYTLWKQKQIHRFGWLIASALFAFSTIISQFFLPKEFNISCAHHICPVIIDILPFLKFAETLHPLLYLIFMNISVYIILFLLINLLLIRIEVHADSK